MKNKPETENIVTLSFYRGAGPLNPCTYSSIHLCLKETVLQYLDLLQVVLFDRAEVGEPLYIQSYQRCLS
jgi:hypothetical protein